jgi:hypothetical protein
VGKPVFDEKSRQASLTDVSVAGRNFSSLYAGITTEIPVSCMGLTPFIGV